MELAKFGWSSKRRTTILLPFELVSVFVCARSCVLKMHRAIIVVALIAIVAVSVDAHAKLNSPTAWNPRPATGNVCGGGAPATTAAATWQAGSTVRVQRVLLTGDLSVTGANGMGSCCWRRCWSCDHQSRYDRRNLFYECSDPDFHWSYPAECGYIHFHCQRSEHTVLHCSQRPLHCSGTPHCLRLSLPNLSHRFAATATGLPVHLLPCSPPHRRRHRRPL